MSNKPLIKKPKKSDKDYSKYKPISVKEIEALGFKLIGVSEGGKVKNFCFKRKKYHGGLILTFLDMAKVRAFRLVDESSYESQVIFNLKIDTLNKLKSVLILSSQYRQALLG